jgi:hypothetical protein
MRDGVRELRQLLNEWDFIGVFDPDTNVDEYDCMIAPVLAKLAEGADSDAIKHWLVAEIAGHFGLSGGRVETARMAERLITWWHNSRRSE